MSIQQTWNFGSWISAPFLKELSRQQMYDMMLAIKQAGIGGTMECAMENGGVVMLHFASGKPLEQRTKLADVLQRESVVVAWMPKLAAVPSLESNAYEAGREPVTFSKIVISANEIFAQAPELLDEEQWVALFHGTELIATSRPSLEFAGQGIATGMIAQVNGAFRDVFQNKVLTRFTLDCGGVRFGYRHLQTGWMVLYRINAANQKSIHACCTGLADLLRNHQSATTMPEIRSRAITARKTQYGLLRPHYYRRAEKLIRRELSDLEQSWRHFWFQYRDRVVFALPKQGEARQEISGTLEQLLILIRRAFEPLAGGPAVDLVLHAPGTTIWCDFFDEGFWATQFETEEVAYRRVSRDAADRGYDLVRRAFAQPARL